jgi:hypothetical protein
MYEIETRLAPEELDPYVANLIKEFNDKEKMRKAIQLNENLNTLSDLLDFNTYQAYRIQFEERESFSLKHIIGLIKIYKSNNGG